MTRPTGRVLVAVTNGVYEFEDFTPKRFWFYGPDRYSWPIRVYRGGDEACNPTIVLATWLGSLVVVTSRRLNSSTPPEVVADMLRPD